MARHTEGTAAHVGCVPGVADAIFAAPQTVRTKRLRGDASLRRVQGAWLAALAGAGARLSRPRTVRCSCGSRKPTSAPHDPTETEGPL